MPHARYPSRARMAFPFSPRLSIGVLAAALNLMVFAFTLLTFMTSPKSQVRAPLPRTESHSAVEQARSRHRQKALNTVKQPSKISQYVLPVSKPSRERSWTTENQKTVQAIFSCLDTSSCGQNQTKVVLLASFHFRGALEGWDGGEDVWARSTIMALKSMGYSFLYSWNLERTIQLYQTFPSLITMILAETGDVEQCFKDPSGCYMSDQKNPDGIPAWKLFEFNWWTSSSHPLGPKWTLSPERYLRLGKENSYLGYSIEPACDTRSFVPHKKRPAQVYVMGKNARYFSSDYRAWDPESLQLASSTTQVKFLAAVRDDKLPTEFTKALDNLGFLSQENFYTELARSVALVGMGSPATSPTPYDAMCMGVPFINPILEWDIKNPENRSQWHTQHENLQFLDPPYVYNVFKGDRAGFVRAIQHAIERPIDRYVLEEMRLPAIEQHLAIILTTDWKAEAKRIIDRRRAGGAGEIFLL
ncbi:hypothetical protein DFH09DRAFT_981160 [Mycena vulgaris]|nr:hypothetical protein DFH09DRAFT_981160 [Mycena vulgaris]